MKKPSLMVIVSPSYVSQSSRDRTRNNIACTVDDLVSSFLYYDRKEDKFLPLNAIEDAIHEEVVTIDEIVDLFDYTLRAGIGEDVK